MRAPAPRGLILALSAAIAVVLGLGIWQLATPAAAPAPPPTAAPTTPAAPVSTSGEIDGYYFAAGMCLTAWPTEEAAKVPLVPCGTGHLAQIVGHGELPEGEFNEQAVAAESIRYCREMALPLFDQIPRDQWGSIFAIRTRPSPELWADGYRTVNCAIGVDPGFTLTGSFLDGDAQVVPS